MTFHRAIPIVFTAAVLGTTRLPTAAAQSPFTHQIPIKLPKGSNGMQPELALVYSPGGGNGIAGMGWQLTGLSAISRVNYGNGINFAGGDSYAHSQFGVLIRQVERQLSLQVRELRQVRAVRAVWRRPLLVVRRSGEPFLLVRYLRVRSSPSNIGEICEIH